MGAENMIPCPQQLIVLSIMGPGLCLLKPSFVVFSHSFMHNSTSATTLTLSTQKSSPPRPPPYSTTPLQDATTPAMRWRSLRLAHAINVSPCLVIRRSVSPCGWDLAAHTLRLDMEATKVINGRGELGRGTGESGASVHEWE